MRKCGHRHRPSCLSMRIQMDLGADLSATKIPSCSSQALMARGSCTRRIPNLALEALPKAPVMSCFFRPERRKRKKRRHSVTAVGAGVAGLCHVSAELSRSMVRLHRVVS